MASFRIELEKECSRCGGTGYDNQRYGYDDCQRCKGTGKVLAEDGEILIAFLKKYRNEIDERS
jgi:DnaJ-class molecular chaperone